MTREQLFDILRPVIIGVTGVPECILADQSVTAPSGDYCSVEPFTNMKQLGRGNVKIEEVDPLDGNPNFKDQQATLTSQVETTVSVNFYRGAAMDYAHKLMFADQRFDVGDYLFENGVGWMGCDNVNNLTMLNSGLYEPRSQIGIVVRFAHSQSSIVQQIYSSSWEIENESGDVISSGGTEI